LAPVFSPARVLKGFMNRLLFLLLTLTAFASAQGPTYPYTVNLSFTASTGTVTGYNMYRSPYTSACGSYAKLNATPFTGTTYTDNNPPQGAYCYGATALDGTVESGFSNIDSNLQIPPPPPTNLGYTIAKDGSKEDLIFAWTNPDGTLDANTLYCGPTEPNARAFKITPHSTGLRLYSAPTGKEKCAITASSKTGESGLSNTISIDVP